MKVTELRIGNLVDYSGECEVLEIHGYDIQVRYSGINSNWIVITIPIDSIHLKPIPITEEWLIK